MSWSGFKLNQQQRYEAEQVLCDCIDDPEGASFEIVGLRAQCALLRGALKTLHHFQEEAKRALADTEPTGAEK